MHIRIFRPGDYDREQIERARDLIKLAKQVLAESDPSILLRWQIPKSRSDGRSDSRE
jgi:hypothetical protein